MRREGFKKSGKKVKSCGCPTGRPFNLEHPTCRTCPIECHASRRRGVQEVVNTWFSEKTLHTTAYLYSPNHWHGRPRYVYLAQKQKWLKVLEGTWALWGKQKGGVRRIIITRQVTSDDQLIMDPDNLMHSLKPVLDAIKLQGVIVDDSLKYIEVPTPVQRVGERQVVTIDVRDCIENCLEKR